MSKPSRRRAYTKEFKIESVQLALTSEKSIAEIAQDLGVAENNLRRWINQYEEDPEHSFPGVGKLKAPDEEIRQLRKRLADAEMERDILKKALAIFSKENHRNTSS
jgi:transposase